MGKFFNKIIILLIVIAIFMAPISAGVKTKTNGQLTLGLEKNKAEASYNMKDLFGTSTLSDIKANSNSVSFTANLVLGTDTGADADNNKILKGYELVAGSYGHPEEGILFIIKNKEPGTSENDREIYLTGFTNKSGDQKTGFFDPTKPVNTIYANSDSSLTPNTNYSISLKVKGDITTGAAFFPSWTSQEIPFKTTDVNKSDPTNTSASASGTASGQAGLNLGCTSLLSISLSACVAQLTYIIWSVTALVAELAARFLDFFVYYATNSSSYNNAFVKQAWAAVRDIANIFFIIALLYVAIKTILGLNVSDNKKLIGSVIIIALIINFSLFTTELVIDGSNILAKVFYNNITSNDSTAKNADGTPKSATGSDGEKSISVGIVRNYNPQKLVEQSDYTSSPYIFILMNLVLIFVTLYTAYIFFSVALLFVARVASLWIYMIFSPIAFASYTVPFEIPGFGHKEWWTEMVNNALLAPVFIFFLYIIVLFTGFLNGIIKYTDSPNITTTANTMQHVMAVIIPFIIIATLLSKAKELAVTYAGEMGKAIQGAAAAVGGLAIGGAGLGLAAAGRGTARAIMKRASQGKSAEKVEGFKKAEIKYNDTKEKYNSKEAEHNKAKIEHGKALTEFNNVRSNPASTIEQVMAAETKLNTAEAKKNTTGVEKENAGNEHAAAKTEMDTAKGKLNVFNKTFGGLGAYINKDQHDAEHGAHARHELDEETGKRFPGKKFKDLTGTEQTEVKERITRDKTSEKKFGKKYNQVTKEQKEIVDEIAKDETQKNKGVSIGDKLANDAKKKQTLKSNILQSARTGTYDFRNLSKLTPGEGDSTGSKIAKGITAALTGSLRGGLKGALNINYGEGQGKLIKDLGHTITEALKGTKIKVDLSSLGKEHKEEHHGGGGHDTHGGGGHDTHGGGGGDHKEH